MVREISEFCVVQLTRQRARESLLSQLTEQCTHCGGKGYVKSVETLSYEIIREINSRISKPPIEKITISAAQNVLSYLKQYEEKNLKKMATRHKLEFIFETKENLPDGYEINI